MHLIQPAVLAVLQLALAAPTPPASGYYDTVTFQCNQTNVPEPGPGGVGYSNAGPVMIDWNGMGLQAATPSDCQKQENPEFQTCFYAPADNAINKQGYTIESGYDAAGGDCVLSFTYAGAKFNAKDGTPTNGAGNCGTDDKVDFPGYNYRDICYVHLGV